MKYAKIKGLNKSVSKMVFGTATPKLFAANEPGAGVREKEEAFGLLDQIYAAGINTFDCAHHYGEEITGLWMEERGVRNKCVVITKGAHPNAWRTRVTEYDILADAHDSLKKLGVDCIDIYMLHRDDANVPVSVVVETLNRLYGEGKIKVFGGSNWTHQRIQEANEYAAAHHLEPFRVSSPNFGLAEQTADPWRCDAPLGDGCVTISGPENRAAREWYTKEQMPVFAYSSLARGFFSGLFKSNAPEDASKILDGPGMTGYFCRQNLERLARCEQLAERKGITVAQVALAWIYHQKFEVFALSSPVTREQIEQNIAAVEISFTEEETAWLNLE